MSLQAKIRWLIESNLKPTLRIPIKDIHDWQVKYYSDPNEEYNHPAYSKVKEKYMNQLRKAIRSGKKLPPVGVAPIITKKDRKFFKEDHGYDPPKDKKWSLEDGHHRLLAHILEGKKTIQAYPCNEKISDYHKGDEDKPSIAHLMSKVNLTKNQIDEWRFKIRR